MNPFPKEHELTEFFGGLPQLTDAGIPWFYNGLTFVCAQGADVVRIEIEPADRILRVLWTRNAVDLVRLHLERVEGLRLDRDEGQDVLVVSLDRRDADDLRLRISPTVHLQWSYRHPLA